MMGVAGILGGALLSAIHGATVINTIYQDGEDPEFETFYTKNILLNEGIRLWMAVQDQPHENIQFPEEVISLFSTFSTAGGHLGAELTLVFIYWANYTSYFDLYHSWRTYALPF